MSTEKTESKSGKNWLGWILGCFGIFLLICSFTLNGILGFLLVGAYASQSVSGISDFQYLENFESGNSDATDKIAVISISGVIDHESPDQSFFGDVTPGVESIVEQLEAAATDPDVKAVVLSVNSPGGSVSASDVLYNAVTELQVVKPVVAHYQGVSASGAYYGTVSADYIVSDRSALIGSIGVILSSLNLEGLYEKVGLRQEVFKSGENKDILSPYRPATDEERDIMQGLIDDSYDQFVSLVNAHRSIPVSRQSETYDGRIFTANQSLELGLIDEIGYIDSAFIEAASLGDTSYYKVVSYEQPFSFSGLFGAVTSVLHQPSVVEQFKKEIKSESPQLLFLWQG